MNDNENLSHTTWECKYHIVFIPKYRQKTLYEQLRVHLGPVFRKLAEQKESRVEEGHIMRDRVHMMLSVPPKVAVSHVVGYIKGKSAIHIARTYEGRPRNYVGHHFWARGYFVSTVGRDEKLIREYIRNFAGAVVASHGLLDTLTDGGLGVALLWPLSNQRFFAPWRPLPVAPIGFRLISPYGAGHLPATTASLRLTTWPQIEDLRAQLTAALATANHAVGGGQLFARAFVDGFTTVAMARVFAVLPFRSLPAAERASAEAFAIAAGRSVPLDPSVPVLTLLGTAGVVPAWNDRLTSAGHRAIPLIDKSLVEGAPMIAELLAALHIDLSMLHGDATVNLRAFVGGTNHRFLSPTPARRSTRAVATSSARVTSSTSTRSAACLAWGAHTSAARWLSRSFSLPNRSIRRSWTATLASSAR